MRRLVRLGPLAVELAELAGGDGLQQSGGEQALIAVGLPGKDPRLTGGEAAGVLGGLGAQRRSLEALPLGRRQRAVSFQSGNLPAVGTGASGSGSRGIGRTKKPEHSKGLFAVPSAR